MGSDYFEGATVHLFWTTNDATGAPVAPSSAFEAADLKIYKDGGAAQKTTTNGIAMDSPFDGLTGFHHVAIDTSIDTGDAGFWAAGSDYEVVLDPDETVDGVAVRAIVGRFSIEREPSGALARADVVVDTTVTPWQLVFYRRGAAQIAANELMRQNLTKADGTNVTAETDIVGQREAP